MPDTVAALTLPTGVWRGENCYRNVTIRALRGEDELLWQSLPEGWSLPQRVTALLAQVMRWEDASSAPSVPLPAPDGLTVGDREALLLHLRRVSFGSRIECVLNCPHCGEKLDLDLNADDLLLPPYDQPQAEYQAELDDGDPGHRYRVSFRLPTGADQAHVATVARSDLDAAEQALIDRCVSAVSYRDQRIDRLPESLSQSLGDRMATLDPQAELSIDMTCPVCEKSFTTLLDMAQYLATEIADRSALLDREIHTLALYYHWSETEILHLPVQRRQTYLRLLDESFGGGSLA